MCVHLPLAGTAWNWILGENMQLPGLLATMCTCTADSSFCKLRSVCRFYTLILEQCSCCDPWIGISLITSIWRRVLFPWSILASKSSTHELEMGSSHVGWRCWCKKNDANSDCLHFCWKMELMSSRDCSKVIGTCTANHQTQKVLRTTSLTSNYSAFSNQK